MIACVFAGQGSQYVGMGSKLAAENAAARLVYEEASTVIGTDLLSLDEAMLSQTRFAQLAIVTLSLAGYSALQAEGVLAGPIAYAGFSLGEYSALGAAGILSTADLLKLVGERSRLMQEAAEINPGTMYAILGLDDARIEAILDQEQYRGHVFPVNYNCPGQLVIAGQAERTAAAADELKTAGAKRALKLAVNGAFHTRFMSPAAPGLRNFAQQLTFNQPQGRFFSNRTGDELSGTTNWPDYLADHLCNAVRWTSEVQSLDRAGVTSYIEIGPGKVLSGLIKKTVSGAAIANVEDPESLKAAATLLK